MYLDSYVLSQGKLHVYTLLQGGIEPGVNSSNSTIMVRNSHVPPLLERGHKSRDRHCCPGYRMVAEDMKRKEIINDMIERVNRIWMHKPRRKVLELVLSF